MERASHKYVSSILDLTEMPGDEGYAPPEQLYGWHDEKDFSFRYLADLFQLGSLLFFYFLSCSAAQMIQLKLSEKHEKKFSRTDFVHDLPYIQYAFGESITDLKSSVQQYANDLTDEIVTIARQLCEPDPRLRGDRKVLASSFVQQHDLQPYISRFDRLSKTVEKRI